MIALTGSTVGGPGRLSGDPTVGSMSKRDFLVILGGTDIGAPRSVLDTVLPAYRDLPCSVLFIDGVGDDHDLYAEYPARPWNGGLAQWFCRGVMRLCRSQVFTISDMVVLTMGGGTAPGRDDAGKYYDWWPEQDITGEDVDLAVCNLGNRTADLVLSDVSPGSDASLSELSGRIPYRRWFFSDGGGNPELPESRASGIGDGVFPIV